MSQGSADFGGGAPVIDPPSHIVGAGIGAVAPPRVFFRRRIELAEGIVESGFENTAKAPTNCKAKVRFLKAAFQDCFKFERKLGNLGSEISAKK